MIGRHKLSLIYFVVGPITPVLHTAAIRLTLIFLSSSRDFARS